VSDDPGYVATFQDGPLAVPDQDRHFSVGPPADRIWFAPLSVGKGGWALVGLGTLEPEHAWPGQVRYVLTDTVDSRSGALAFYRRG